MFATGLLLLSVLSSIVSVSALPKPEPEQEQPVRRSALPTRWYHKRDHPVHELLKRDSPLPAVGSPRMYHFSVSQRALHYPFLLPSSSHSFQIIHA